MPLKHERNETDTTCNLYYVLSYGNGGQFKRDITFNISFSKLNDPAFIKVE